MADQPQNLPPVRTVAKGDGDYVIEKFTDAVKLDDKGNPKVLRVNCYLKEQLLGMKGGMEKQYNDNVSKVNEMLALLV